MRIRISRKLNKSKRKKIVKKISNNIKKWNKIFKKCISKKQETILLSKIKGKKLSLKKFDNIYESFVNKNGNKCLREKGLKIYNRVGKNSNIV